ncbi:hypothetical protein M3J09_011938 [Ascochyta lentis]
MHSRVRTSRHSSRTQRTAQLQGSVLRKSFNKGLEFKITRDTVLRRARSSDCRALAA